MPTRITYGGDEDPENNRQNGRIDSEDLVADAKLFGDLTYEDCATLASWRDGHPDAFVDQDERRLGFIRYLVEQGTLSEFLGDRWNGDPIGRAQELQQLARAERVNNDRFDHDYE